MAKKKKATNEDVYTYRIVVSEVHSPTKWKTGEWVKNKEALGGYEFTGETVADLLGYQLIIMAYCNDQSIGICESIPNGFQTSKKIHKTEQEAWDYLETYKKLYKSDLNIGDVFTPFVSRFVPGKIVE